MHNGRIHGGFTLIELLIVIGLLGALATLVLPRLTVEKEWAVDESLAPKEMMDIRRAYAAFEADCVPTKGDRELIAKYGLEILMKYESRGWSFPASFDPARGKGWRGPYIQQEGTRTVDVSLDTSPNPDVYRGQTTTGGDTDIPVILDPRHDTDADTAEAPREDRFYRVLYEPTSGHLALVYVGTKDQDGNGDLLDAKPDEDASAGDPFADCFVNHHQAEGDGYDDMIRPLSTQ
jgi:prepilin-type N-terminal cleavage/methylation domain-containing protein